MLHVSDLSAVYYDEGVSRRELNKLEYIYF